MGAPTGMQSFVWDTLADGVGFPMPHAGVLSRATVTDGVAPSATCETAPYPVDK